MWFSCAFQFLDSEHILPFVVFVGKWAKFGFIGVGASSIHTDLPLFFPQLFIVPDKKLGELNSEVLEMRDWFANTWRELVGDVTIQRTYFHQKPKDVFIELPKLHS